jgi:SAM-dependent methyltransferase
MRPRNLIFDEAPALYDRARPGYPDAAIEAAVQLAELNPGSRVLEIGAGTGQLTLPLLQRGIDVIAVEPGLRMATLLERKLRRFGAGRVLPIRFEDVDLPAASFDALASATAFHWVDPDRRYELAARLLRRNGCLAIITNDHVLTTRNAAYYRGARASYRRLAPEMGPHHMPPRPSVLPSLAPDIAHSGLFDVLPEHRFGWDRRYTAPELIRLLRTYSPHRAMPPPKRRVLFDELRTLIDDRLGGSFIDRYITTVCVARKISSR